MFLLIQLQRFTSKRYVFCFVFCFEDNHLNTSAADIEDFFINNSILLRLYDMGIVVKRRYGRIGFDIKL